MPEFKKTVCLDFDGVMHSYSSGWKGVDVIPDPPVPGTAEALEAYLDAGFEVVIYSSRSKEAAGIRAMKEYIALEFGHAVERQLQFAAEKPAAWLTIDDRAIRFDGTWPTVEEIDGFKPWNKR